MNAPAKPGPKGTIRMQSVASDGAPMGPAMLPPGAHAHAAAPLAAVPQAAVPQAAVPQAAVPQAAVPQAAVPREAFPSASAASGITPAVTQGAVAVPSKQAISGALAIAERSLPIDDQPRSASMIRFGQALRQGESFRGYRVERFINAGGTAEVYEALQIATKKRVALKVLNVVLAGRPENGDRMRRESEALQLLQHVPGVVRVHETFQVKGIGGVMVLELLEGRTLRDEMNDRSRTPFVKALRLIGEVAETMVAVHQAGFLHRDLKPENIFLVPKAGQRDTSSPYRTVVMDLGCAKLVGTDTSTASLNGTWQYASPEQLGRGEMGPKSDVYALGCTLLELIEGAHGYAYLETRAGVDAAKNVKAAWHVLASVEVPALMPVRIWNEIVCLAIEKVTDKRLSMTDLARLCMQCADDIEASRFSREDFVPAASAGVKARPAPKALTRLSDSKPMDAAPHEVDVHADLKLPSFLVVEGPPSVQGKRYAIGRSLVVGRLLDDEPKQGAGDLTFPIDTLSTRHCQIDLTLEEAVETAYWVQDLDSTNGIEVDGVPAKDGLLRPGSTLRLGGSVILRLAAPGRLDGPKNANLLRPYRSSTLPSSAPSSEPRQSAPSTPISSAPRRGTVPRADQELVIEEALRSDPIIQKGQRTKRALLIAMIVMVLAFGVFLLFQFHVISIQFGGGK